ncbi:hypothetical protein C9374_011734 [Naegleria lovaniensis]|uniref:N-acetyltransferase domain-containing protein n=1 Tax=Naegleria lovaniensis TaxID=51637 RepID=A0AA88KEN7_NAELO|nr:uncharacterized protein C9374_011734 [Naegleria lovaniensis]KAG2373849.1 hypothetical protein C9374_011734 [Naegleria lovaniensis]
MKQQTVTLPAHLKCSRAVLSEQEEIKQFHVPIHLETSTRNEEERMVQESCLAEDFPALYSQHDFEECSVWTLRDEASNRVIGCVDLYISPTIQTEFEVFATLEVAYRNQDEELNAKLKNGKQAWIRMLSIHPLYRKQGLGRYLLHVALDEARQQQVDTVLLVTLPEVMQSAVKLYESEGFQLLERDRTSHFVVDTMVLLVK